MNRKKQQKVWKSIWHKFSRNTCTDVQKSWKCVLKVALRCHWHRSIDKKLSLTHRMLGTLKKKAMRIIIYSYCELLGTTVLRNIVLCYSVEFNTNFSYQLIIPSLGTCPRWYLTHLLQKTYKKKINALRYIRKLKYYMVMKMYVL